MADMANFYLFVLPVWLALLGGAVALYFGLRWRRRAQSGGRRAPLGRTGSGILAAVGAVLIVGSLIAIAAPPAFLQGGARMTNSWAADNTCGYGFTAVDCWASNESLNLNGPALTGTVKLDVVAQTGSAGQINPDDIAYTITVKNEGPPVYNGAGQEVAQQVYVQVTSIDVITSAQGVPIPIVQVNSLNQVMVAIRDFADNSFIVEQRQATLGGLLAGASDTAKLNIQLRLQAFQACTVDVGAAYHIRGYVGAQAFDITVYVSTVTNGC